MMRSVAADFKTAPQRSDAAVAQSDGKPPRCGIQRGGSQT